MDVTVVVVGGVVWIPTVQIAVNLNHSLAISVHLVSVAVVVEACELTVHELHWMLHRRERMVWVLDVESHPLSLANLAQHVHSLDVLPSGPGCAAINGENRLPWHWHDLPDLLCICSANETQALCILNGVWERNTLSLHRTSWHCHGSHQWVFVEHGRMVPQVLINVPLESCCWGIVGALLPRTMRQIISSGRPGRRPVCVGCLGGLISHFAMLPHHTLEE